MTPGDVAAGIDAAMTVVATDPALVATEARRHDDDGPAPVVGINDALAGYDRLLTDGALVTVTDIGDHP